MTVHWINMSSLPCKKAAVACKRVRGKHAYDVMGVEIEQIHWFYGLSNRVTAAVTDNRSNFVKVFKMCLPADSDHEEEEDVAVAEDEEEEVTFTDMTDAFSNERDDQFFLPPHHRCASHTITLISTNDADKWLSVSAGPEIKSAEVLLLSARHSGPKQAAPQWRRSVWRT